MTALLLLLLAQIPGGIDLDPRLKWYTVETDHFAVHFPLRGRPTPDSFELAREVAGICEEVHRLLLPAAGWQPEARTNIVIADFYDYPNGWAAPFPHNTITIIPTPPAGDRTNDDDWLRTLILHEYSHILQLDMVSGIPLALRRIFGRVMMPNALAPAWLNEGYAVYNETRFTPFGRLRGAEYQAMLRAARDAGQLLSVDRCGSYELRRWPGGTAPYLYGSRLHGHAASTGDSAAWDRYNRHRSASLPFTENASARRTFGRDIGRIWAEAAAAVPAGAGADLPTPTRLTRTGFSTGRPCWSADGTRVYFVDASRREYPSIKEIDLQTRSTRILHRGSVNGRLAGGDSGRALVFAQLDRRNNYYDIADIYRLNPAGGRARRLTHGERARDPDLAADTAVVVFVTGNRGKSALKLLDVATGTITTLAESEERVVYSSPRFSPGGRWIAVSKSRPGGWTNIELIDRRSGWSIPVTDDRANDITPAWSRTGRTLFFISDRSGTYQLYAYQLASAATYQCTHSRYGVFEPDVSPDNQHIALTALGPDGTDVVSIPLAPADWTIALPFVDTLPESEPAAQPATGQVYYYNPFPSLMPRFWLPWLDNSDGLRAGAFTVGWDALQVHRYSVAAGWQPDRRTPHVEMAYEYRGLWPVLGASIRADRTRQEAAIAAGLQFRQTGVTDWLDVGLTAVRDTLIRSRTAITLTRSDALGWRYTAAPVQGGQYGVHADADPARLATRVPDLRLLAYAVRYLGAPPSTWSLRTHAAIATAPGADSASSAWRLSNQGILGVRGFRAPAPAGRSLLTAGLQLRTPLAWVERGLGTAPVFLSNINIATFAEAGIHSRSLLPGPAALPDARVAVGGELRADVVLLHLVPASAAAGIGIGINPCFDWRAYLAVESSILSELLFARADLPARLP